MEFSVNNVKYLLINFTSLLFLIFKLFKYFFSVESKTKLNDNLDLLSRLKDCPPIDSNKKHFTIQ